MFDNGQLIYPQYLDELDPFPKLHTFLRDNPWAFMFEEVPELDRLSRRCTDFWMLTGSRLWDKLCSSPETFLRPLPENDLPTIEHEDDKPGFIHAFYQDMRSFKKWATTAYNEHVQTPMVRTATLAYKHFLKTCGRVNDLADIEDKDDSTASD